MKGARAPYVANNEELVDPADDNHPESVWRKLISQQDQIFLVLSGHQAGQSRRVDNNDAGHAVYQVMADYQDRFQSALDAGFTPSWPTAGIGDGWMQLMRFDMAPEAPSVQVKTYSTHYKKFSSEMPD